MVEWVVRGSVLAVMLVSGAVGMKIGKRWFMSFPVLVVGFPKKNRVAVSDERLKPALWRSRYYMTWLMSELCFWTALATMDVIWGNWALAALWLLLCAVCAVPPEVMRRKRYREFLAEADRLGVVLERGEQAVKAATADVMGRFGKRYGWLYIGLAVIMAFNAIMQFIAGHVVIGGFFSAGAAAYAAVIVYYRIKGKRG